ncbi:DUF3885 domain-containing protein [Actinocorallia libanotica]|uniref:DUF3885 domain-containing protein n=1 Tax=Actinocorallia libanotica TaxID=46162 RepID=A0ABN1R1J7_9ACTN
MTEGDLAGLTAVWRARWGGSPVGYELRERFADRWVRFHSLPESKRYAETEAEYGVVLDRHRTLLRALGVEDRLCLIAGYFEEAEGPASPHPDHPDPDRPDPDRPGPDHPGAVPWLTVMPDERSFFEIPLKLYVSEVVYGSATLDPFLRGVADERLGHAIISPPDLRWLYHPYDGGGDVIAATVRERDALKSRYASWLSEHPSGL